MRYLFARRTEITRKNWSYGIYVIVRVRQVVILHSKVCTKISLGGPQSGRYEELVVS